MATDPLVWRLFVVVVAADAAVVGLHLVNELSGSPRAFFALDQEQNLPTWLSSVQLFGVAAGAALAAGGWGQRTARAWLALAAIFALFSLDELAMIHEEVVEWLAGNPDDPVWYWPLVFSPIFVAALLAVAAVARDVKRSLGSPALALAAFAIFGASLVLEGAGAKLVDHWLYKPEVVLEESFELLGSALLLAVAWSVAARRLGLRGSDSSRG